MTSRVAALLLLAVLGACGDDGGSAGPDANPNPGPKPVVVMTTSRGNLVVELESEHMPRTTANFLAYVDAGWYDGTLVHRTDADWVIQGGGYTAGLMAKTPMPAIELETSTQVRHVHGAISMARSNDRNSATSQWFIVHWPHASAPPHAQLDGAYAAFGHVIEGLDVLDTIAKVPTRSTGGLDNVPVTEVVVTSAARR